MRLSEIEDRNDIGKSAALSDDQINEIPKLEQGVAIIYQSGWENAVLCKITPNNYNERVQYNKNSCTKNISRELLGIVVHKYANNLKKEEVEQELIYNDMVMEDLPKDIKSYLFSTKNYSKEETIKFICSQLPISQLKKKIERQKEAKSVIIEQFIKDNLVHDNKHIEIQLYNMLIGIIDNRVSSIPPYDSSERINNGNF
jgi:hypothetical protein